MTESGATLLMAAAGCLSGLVTLAGPAGTAAMAGTPTAAAAPARSSDAPMDTLARHRGRDRVLVVAAPTPGDTRLAAQREAMRAMAPGARERDLVLVEAVGQGAGAEAVRAALNIPPGRFEVVLVGKDGGAKLRSDTVLAADRLFPTIDAMPMRRQEMRQRP